MPFRNGRIEKWKHKVPGFSRIASDESLSLKEKLAKLAEELGSEGNKPWFTKDGECFPSRINSLVEEFGDREEVLEPLAERLVNDIYDYADNHLIWMSE